MIASLVKGRGTALAVLRPQARAVSNRRRRLLASRRGIRGTVYEFAETLGEFVDSYCESPSQFALWAQIDTPL